MNELTDVKDTLSVRLNPVENLAGSLQLAT
jgi:hypothetical protein